MSSKYQVHDNELPHFVTFTVVGWVDVFSRPLYKDLLVESLSYCQQHKGLLLHAWVIPNIGSGTVGENIKNDVKMNGKCPAAKACVAESFRQPIFKKMKTTKMNLADVQGKLSSAKMKNIIPGNETVVGGSCFLRFDQTTTVGIEVADCSRATMKANCTGDTKPVCVC